MNVNARIGKKNINLRAQQGMEIIEIIEGQSHIIELN
jgi:hypothetical protein